MDNYPINNSQDALLIEINYYITYIYLYLKKKILTNIPHFCGFIPIVEQLKKKKNLKKILPHEKKKQG